MPMENQFSSSFKSYACVGDTITAEIEGFTVVARLEFDEDARPQDHGFDPDDSDYGEENSCICASWERNEWEYVGVILSVSKAGIMLDKHAVSSWGIEANFPGSDNSLLTEVANELLPEALESAKALLKELCAA